MKIDCLKIWEGQKKIPNFGFERLEFKPNFELFQNKKIPQRELVDKSIHFQFLMIDKGVFILLCKVLSPLLSTSWKILPWILSCQKMEIKYIFICPEGETYPFIIASRFHHKFSSVGNLSKQTCWVVTGCRLLANVAYGLSKTRALYMGELQKNTTSTGTITKKTW